jgi:hypothetical protein
MTRLWKRQMRRPAWKRDRLPYALSDYDPLAPAFAAANRLRERESRSLDQMRALLDRLDERDRDRAERERAARDARLRAKR